MKWQWPIFIILQLSVSTTFDPPYFTGIPCTSTTYCQILLNKIEEKIDCVSGKCLCRLGMSENYWKCYNDEDYLFSEKARKLPFKCRQNSDCSISHSKCQQLVPREQSVRYCVCQNGFIHSEYKCLPIRKFIGETCISQRQCRHGIGPTAYCNAIGKCQCHSGFHNSSNLRQCIVTELDDKCECDGDCLMVERAECLPSKYNASVKVCSCALNTIESESGNKCLDRKKLGQRCEEDVQCGVFGDDTACVDNKCGFNY